MAARLFSILCTLVAGQTMDVFRYGRNTQFPLRDSEIVVRGQNLPRNSHVLATPIWDSIADSASLAARLFGTLCTLE